MVHAIVRFTFQTNSGNTDKIGTQSLVVKYSTAYENDRHNYRDNSFPPRCTCTCIPYEESHGRDVPISDSIHTEIIT